MPDIGPLSPNPPAPPRSRPVEFSPARPSAKGSLFFPLPVKAAAPDTSWTLDQGVDITAAAHTPLLAVGSGTIVHHGITGFGPWAPVLKLDSGGFVYYGHAGPGNLLPVGSRVNAGDIIGEVGAGQVGNSTGPHLEIGFASNAAGQPAGRSTAAKMKALLQKGPTDVNTQAGPQVGGIPNPLGWAEALAKFLGKLSDPRTWLRVLEVIVGGLLVLMGLKSFTGGAIDPLGTVTRGAAAAAKVVPV